MAIKLYYNKTTYQLIGIDDNSESLIVGDDGGKELYFYFGTGANIGAFINDATIPLNYLGRGLFERADGASSGEVYLTPVLGTGGGYFKLVLTGWFSDVDGNLEITARLKVSDGNGGYVVTNFSQAILPIEPGVAPTDDTITDAQYQAIQDAVNDVITGETDIAYDNTVSELEAETVQEAIDEIDSKVDDIIAGTQALDKIVLTDLEIDKAYVVDKVTRLGTAESDINTLQSDKEDKSNKVTVFQVTPTDTAYPSEKLVKDTTDALDGRLDTAEGDIDDLENANMIKSIVRTGTNLVTITYYNNTTATVITLAELKAFIGEATTSLSGLMSASDKTHLDTLMALFDSDADNVVNTIAEILAIFEDYPEGVDLVTVLAGKEDVDNKVSAFQATPDDDHYPTEKLVKDSLDDIQADIATLDEQKANRYIDTPIAELNNHSLREVFEDGNLISNGDFSDGTTGWTLFGASGSVTDGIYSLTPSQQFGRLETNNNVSISGHTYYTRANVKISTTGVSLGLLGGNNPVEHSGSGQYEILSTIELASQNNKLVVTDGKSSGWSQIDVDYVSLYDLTSLGLSSLTVSQMDFWYGVYETYKDDDGIMAIVDKENVANKKTAWQATPTDDAYPSEKLVKDTIDALDVRVDTLESKIDVIGLDYKEYGVREVVGQSASEFERVTRFWGGIKLGSATGLVANVAIDDAVVVNSFDYIPIFKREKVEISATDLSSNTVANTFVKVPKYYIKEEWTNEGGTDYHYIFMSQFKHEGYRLPLPFKKTDGSERDYTYMGAYEAFLDGNNKLRSLTGQFPKVNYSRNNFRTAARALDGLGVNSKYQITDLAEYVDLVQIPFMIEFATKHSQGIFSGATSMAYSASHTAVADGTSVNFIVVSNATGANFVLGQTVSIGTSNSNDSIAKDRIVTQIQVDTPNEGETTITFDGAAVDIAIGNVVASRAWKTGMTDSVKVSGSHALNDGKHSIVWRGLENPFGNIWKNVDGVKISNWRAYVTENPKDYNDTASVAGIYAEPYLPLGYLNADTNDYAQDLGYDANYPYAKFPISVQASSGLFFRDYYYQNSGDRTVFVGGYFYNSSLAGIFYWTLSHDLGYTNFNFGARLSYRP